MRSAALSSSKAKLWIISAVLMQSTVGRSHAKATSHCMDRHHAHCRGRERNTCRRVYKKWCGDRLNTRWLFNVLTLSWSCVYSGFFIWSIWITSFSFPQRKSKTSQTSSRSGCASCKSAHARHHPCSFKANLGEILNPARTCYAALISLNYKTYGDRITNCLVQSLRQAKDAIEGPSVFVCGKHWWTRPGIDVNTTQLSDMSSFCSWEVFI